MKYFCHKINKQLITSLGVVRFGVGPAMYICLWLTCYLNLNVKLLLPVITCNMQVYYLEDCVRLYKHVQ